ncbi:MAG TPA: ComF family protein [Devosia sp.]|nr:ComF family protein [Devosia sp.]
MRSRSKILGSSGIERRAVGWQDGVMETGASLVKNRDFGAPLRWLGGAILDLIYPPVCLACDAPVASADALCTACFRELRPITAPLCPVLGLPFEVSLGPGARSAEAIADPPPFDRARAAVIYNDVARRIVSRLKYSDRPELARLCASLMAQAGHELWGGGAVLLPVPLHPLRQLSRRYNQSTELARALSRLTGIPVDPVLALRRKRTRQQVGLSADGRQRNVAGAFAPHPDLLQRLRGRRVIIVDDVVTTGATVKSVTRALKAGGGERVDVISFARVVPGRSDG